MNARVRARMSKWLRGLDKLPGLGFSGWLLGVVGFGLGFWFYQRSLDSRQLVVLEPSVRAVLVDKETPPSIEIRVGGKPISKQDVYAVQLAVWNAGNRSVRPEHVLTPILFVPGKGETVVDASVLRDTRKLCGIKPVIRPTDGHVQFEFAILEPGDGAVIQLIIAGKKDAPLGMKGNVEAGDKPRYRRISPKDGKSSTSWSTGTSGLLSAAIGLAFAAFVVLGGWFIIENRQEKKRPAPPSKTDRVMVTAFGVAMMLFGVALAYAVVADYVNAESMPSALQEPERVSE